ncbi:hypothetical protein L7F22_012585 [Adiantum nelumboides]|nr:hypothetical protein [Adiantum nelumboides]
MGRKKVAMMWAIFAGLVCVLMGGVVLASGEEVDAYGENQTLLIWVPRKLGFLQFVNISCPNNDSAQCNFTGFAVEVFKSCIQNLSSRRSLRIDFRPFGDGVADPSYDEMVEALKNKSIHGIVGDLTITAKRMQKIDFTHPYVQSTLVMTVPYRDTPKAKQLWSFMEPFSRELWSSILLLFISTAIVTFILEYNNPQFHQEGHDWKHRLGDVFWLVPLVCKVN